MRVRERESERERWYVQQVFHRIDRVLKEKRVSRLSGAAQRILSCFGLVWEEGLGPASAAASPKPPSGAMCWVDASFYIGMYRDHILGPTKLGQLLDYSRLQQVATWMYPKGHGQLHCRFRNLLYRVQDPQNSYGLGFQTLWVGRFILSFVLSLACGRRTVVLQLSGSDCTTMAQTFLLQASTRALLNTP